MYASLKTVSSLLLTNADFRLFLSDVNTIGRQVFADSAFSLSHTAEQAGKAVEPSKSDAKALQGPGADEAPAPTSDELVKDPKEVSEAVVNGLAQTGADAVRSVKSNVSGEQKEAILYRLKQAVLRLRQRPDYNESVSTVGMLVERYVTAYARVADRTLEVAQEDVQRNEEMDRAAKNFWSLLTSFGEADEWRRLEEQLGKVLSHTERDMDFEKLMADVIESLQRMFTDPDFFDTAEEKLVALKEESQSVGIEGSMRKDVDDLLAQLRRTMRSVVQDTHVAKLITTGWRIVSVLFPEHALANNELLDDALRVFIPMLIQAIQYVPIPRLEVSVPELDLLLENLILEPGTTVNHSSFLPYRLRVETHNAVEVRKAKFRTASTGESLTTIKIDGLSLRADDLGYWLRLHSGLLRFTDVGLASFALDHRGIDIHLDVELGRDRLEQLVTLRDVRVHIHHFSYTLRQSKFAFLGWLLKPLLRPLLRKIMERQLATALADGFHFLNRELAYARERLRATRIASPDDLATFVRAVAARLVPPADPDVYTAVGVRPSGGVFRGRYAPGSLVQVWETEARQAAERVEDWEREGWRNDVFDVNVSL